MNRGVLAATAFLLVLGMASVCVFAIDCEGNPRCIIRQAAVERNPDVCNQMNQTELVEGCKGYVDEVKNSAPSSLFTPLLLWTIIAVVAIILIVAVVITIKRKNRF